MQRAFFHVGDQIDAGGAQAGRQTRQQRNCGGDCRGEQQDAQMRTKVEGQFGILQHGVGKQTAAPLRHHQSQYSADGGEHAGLHKQLPHHAKACRAQRAANGELAFAR